MIHFEQLAKRYRAQAKSTPGISALELGIQETQDLFRVHLDALELLAKETRNG